jgi:hypothetical protein
MPIDRFNHKNPPVSSLIDKRARRTIKISKSQIFVRFLFLFLILRCEQEIIFRTCLEIVAESVAASARSAPTLTEETEENKNETATTQA